MDDKRISGASAELSKNGNAAWPFGGATLGMFVPALVAIASKSNCSRSIAPLEKDGMPMHTASSAS